MQTALLSNNPPPATREPPLHKGASAISALFHLHSRWLLFAKGYNAKGLWQMPQPFPYTRQHTEA